MATTVIENGIDMPNVNTIIVYLADRYCVLYAYIFVYVSLTVYIVCVYICTSCVRYIYARMSHHSTVYIILIVSTYPLLTVHIISIHILILSLVSGSACLPSISLEVELVGAPDR